MTAPDDQTPVPYHLAQQWAWESAYKTTAMVAGTQGGKTGFGPWWLAREIERRGRGDYLAVTSVYDLFKIKMLPALLMVFEHLWSRVERDDALTFQGRYWAGDRVIEVCDPKTGRYLAQKSSDPMWARVILRSADAKGGLEAGTCKAAWQDEAGQDRFTSAARKGVKRRLAIHEGRDLITTTLYNLGWVKQQVIDVAEAGGEVTEIVLDNGAEITRNVNTTADVCVIQFDSIANPSYPLSEWERAKATMPPDEFAMYWRGRAAQLRTLIYNCYDPDVHKVTSFPIPPEWPRVVGVDPIGEQIAAVWLAYDPEKRQVHWYREYQEPFGLTTPGHVRQILEVTRERGERVLWWIGGAPSERQARLDWAKAGIPLLEPPFADVWTGINRVYQLIAGNMLLIHDCCSEGLHQLGSYQRKKDAQGDLTDKIRDKEKFHLLDALRYAVAFVTEQQPQMALRYDPVRIGAY